MSELQIQIYENQHLVHSVTCTGLVELGRQAQGEDGPYSTRQEGGRWRVVVAPLDEKRVSRRFLVAEALASGQFRIVNLSRLPIRFFDGSELAAGASREMPLPVFLVVGGKQVGIQAPGSTVPLPTPVSPSEPPPRTEPPHAPAFRLLDGNQTAPLQTLAGATIPPGAILSLARPRPTKSSAPDELHDETMIRWLQAAMDVLQSAASSSEFFDKAAAALVDLVGLDLGQVLLFENGKWRLQTYKAATRNHPGHEEITAYLESAGLASKVAASHTQLADERQASRHILNRILAEKRTFWQVPSATPQGSLVGVDAVVAAPILDQSGAVIGALYGDRQGRGFSLGMAAPLTKQDALLVELLAGGVAAGMARIAREQAESQRQKKFMLYERELQIGRSIQVGFLPEVLPQPPDWEIVAHFQPAREVAGDFYDCFPLAANRVALVMADVCDKGVGAALFMALFRSLIRAFCMESPLQAFMGIPEEQHRNEGPLLPANHCRASLLWDVITLLTVERTNKYVTSNHSSACMFVTLFVGVLDTTTGELTYVNAGHDSPTIIGPDGIKTRLEPTGPVVGLMPDAVFNLKKTWLQRGDILLTHTDGVTDARDPNGTSFSEKHFLKLLEASNPSAAALVERIASELRSHIGDADQFDDITLLAARWLPEAPKPLTSEPSPQGG